MQKTYGSSCTTDAIVLQPEVAIIELNLHAVRSIALGFVGVTDHLTDHVSRLQLADTMLPR